MKYIIPARKQQTPEVWFITGSQHLYGDETLKLVADHARTIADALQKSETIPVNITWKPTVTTTEEIYNICQRSQHCRQLHRHHHLDAYFFTEPKCGSMG